MYQIILRDGAQHIDPINSFFYIKKKGAPLGSFLFWKKPCILFLSVS